MMSVLIKKVENVRNRDGFLSKSRIVSKFADLTLLLLKETHYNLILFGVAPNSTWANHYHKAVGESVGLRLIRYKNLFCLREAHRFLMHPQLTQNGTATE